MHIYVPQMRSLTPIMRAGLLYTYNNNSKGDQMPTKTPSDCTGCVGL